MLAHVRNPLYACSGRLGSDWFRATAMMLLLWCGFCTKKSVLTWKACCNHKEQPGLVKLSRSQPGSNSLKANASGCSAGTAGSGCALPMVRLLAPPSQQCCLRNCRQQQQQERTHRHACLSKRSSDQRPGAAEAAGGAGLVVCSRSSSTALPPRPPTATTPVPMPCSLLLCPGILLS